MILDSSILVAFERRRFDLERLLADHTPPAIAAITAAELLIGVERADTPERRSRRESFVQNLFSRMPIIPFHGSCTPVRGSFRRVGSLRRNDR